MKYEIVGIHDAGGVQRAFLKLECGFGCQIPLRTDHAAYPAWLWDGKLDPPSVTPSISCANCGFHKTLTKGEWVI